MNLELNERYDRNTLRNTLIKAEEHKAISRDEIGFVVALVDRFRAETERKMKQLNMLQGEVAQLRVNEQIVINMLENIIAAAQRDVERQETFNQLKTAREEIEITNEDISTEQTDQTV